MRAIILNCTLKGGSTPSSTEALAERMADELGKRGVKSEIIRIADAAILPGVTSDEGTGDGWPAIRQKILDAHILILASPTWVGRLSSYAQLVIERMDAMLSETDDQKRPVAYNHVAGFLATGNEDGAKHVIGEMTAAVTELGFSVPGQAWAYYNNGSAMGKDYLQTDDESKKQRTHKDVATAANNIVCLAEALQARPVTAPAM